MKSILSFVFALILFSIKPTMAQTDARLISNPDVSENKICFGFGDDLWIVDKIGGVASRLSSTDGTEINPRFSPDGKTIAFNANYDGNFDVYSMPIEGGVPKRITSHGMADVLMDWYPNGKDLLYASSMASGKQRFSQFYKISAEGGMPEKLPIEMGEVGSISSDGNRIAFTDKSRIYRNWKRYRGGMAPDIFIMNLTTLESENINKSDANDEMPMWHEDLLYYLSDASENKKYNIWKYDTKTKKHSQVTFFTEYDVHYPAMGPSNLVFESGGKLHLLNLADDTYKEVKISTIGDFASLKKTNKSVDSYLAWFDISPDGNRVLVEARGDIFTLPKEDGFVQNVTRTSGIAERFPAWSPDGKSIACFSDELGEYDLTILDVTNNFKKKVVAKLGPGFRYSIHWSPDSKKLAFIDQTMKMHIVDVTSGKDIVFDKDKYLFQGGLQSFHVSFSTDSKWIAYNKGQENTNNALFIYDVMKDTSHQVTSGFYSDYEPEFDKSGKYLFFKSTRAFSPLYSDYNNTWAYSNGTQLMVLSLAKDTPSILAPQNDTVKMEVAIEKPSSDPEKKTPEKTSKTSKKKSNTKVDDVASADSSSTPKVVIDFDQIEKRVEVLPIEAGNFSSIAVSDGKLVYLRAPNTGSTDKDGQLMFFELKEKEEKLILSGVDGYEMSSDGSAMAVMSSGQVSVIAVSEGAKMDKFVAMSEMKSTVDPKAEWQQIFNDVWRFERDYFYDKDMHGVDWDAMKLRYGSLLESCVSRNDVNFIIGELIAELNASHTYRGGGDIKGAAQKSIGYLGVDWQKSDAGFQIKKIIKGAPWDTEVTSPLSAPGMDVKEGDFILAVNGIPMSEFADPWLAFDGLDNKTVELTYNTTSTFDKAKKVLVKTMGDETRLRNLAWIENNRLMVDKATNGRVGYVYVPSTGVQDGQYELVRMYFAQWNKEGMIIDERFNDGGQIPDRFVELLNKKPLAYFKVRDGKDWVFPTTSQFGPKVMLMNGWSGSGGDAFPDYFRKAGLGPLVGTRTWGGLIGISGAPNLIDGGSVTVPTFRMYNPDGTWFKEGHGVDPDYNVPEDPTALAKGHDTQLEKAIELVVESLKSGKPIAPKQPEKENRSK